MSFPSPTPRRVSRPSWLDLRLVLGVGLVLVAVLVGAKVISAARHTDKRLVLTHDLAAGTTLRTSDLRLVDAQLPLGTGVYVTQKAKAVGRVLNRPVLKGELLPAASLGDAPSRTTVSVPFAADAAPVLHRGQRIVVWLSTAPCPSVVLLPDVTIQDVHAADAGVFASGGTGQDVVLSIAPELAERVVGALAIDNATLRAGVLTGSAAKPTAGLPGLEPCGPSPSGSP